jgi:uncharacterized iron-regulated membrane protein
MEACMRLRHRKTTEVSAPEQSVADDGSLPGRRSVPLRQTVFWLHLTAGVVTGLVIFVMSITGVLLAFERQIVAFAERSSRTVQPPASGASRLDLDTIVARAGAVVPEGRLSGVTLRAEPTAAALVNFGRERVVFVDPYTGTVLGAGATTLRAFFHVVTDWHRWLGREGESRDTGRAITGFCNATFAVMAITGVYLWWPRRWTRRALKAITVPSITLRGKARDWNWHNTVGFWSASLLLCITLTGMVMSYQWANDLLYALTGTTPPPRPARAAEGRVPAPRVTSGPSAGGTERQARPEGRSTGERPGRPAEAGAPAPRAPLEALFATAVQQAPHWRSLTLRLPQRGAAQMTVTLEEADSPHPYPRSILTLDATTATVVQWEPYASYNLGRTLRAWVRPVHTGEAGGLIGQAIATLASAGGGVLVWTGLALAWRRWRGRSPRTSHRTPDVRQEGTAHTGAP